eukprot:80848_1
MTSYAPSELVFTRKIKLPCDLYINHDATHKKDYDTYLKWMIQQQAIIHHNARNASQKYDARRKKTYDLNRKEIPKYKIGDKVLRFVANTKVGNDRKLSESYVGPYKIVQISNKSIGANMTHRRKYDAIMANMTIDTNFATLSDKDKYNKAYENTVMLIGGLNDTF